MAFEIVEVNSAKLLKEFVNLPYKLYAKDPNWVPPLKMAVKDLLSPKHPFYRSGEMKKWLAMQGGKFVGRIAGIINHEHNEFHEEKVGFFGFFECSENMDIAEGLFIKAENWLRSKGMLAVRGPMNPSTNYEVGTLVKGFDDPPQIMMTYNPPYYTKLIENLGYGKSKDLFAYMLPGDSKLPEKIQRISDRVAKSNKITWRNLNKKYWDREVDLMLEIYNDAWEKNWGFVPMSEEEFRHTANDLKQVADENLIFFVEVAGDPAGFLVALPDYNQVFKQIPNGKLFPTGIFKLLTAKKRIDRIRIITMGVKKRYRNLGLAALMYNRIFTISNEQGWREGEMSWVLEDNVEMVKPLKIMGAEQYKTYRIYEKGL